MQTYSTKSNAAVAARAALKNKTAQPGVDFYLSQQQKDGRWVWDIAEAAAAQTVQEETEKREFQERVAGIVPDDRRASVADLSDEIAKARAAGDFDRAEELGEARRAAEVDADEATLRDDAIDALARAGVDVSVDEPEKLEIPAFLRRSVEANAKVAADTLLTDGWEKLAKSPEGKANAASWEKKNGGPVKAASKKPLRQQIDEAKASRAAKPKTSGKKTGETAAPSAQYPEDHIETEVNFETCEEVVNEAAPTRDDAIDALARAGVEGPADISVGKLEIPAFLCRSNEAGAKVAAGTARPQARKRHPVEERDQTWIDKAVEFTATIRAGRKNHTVRTKTLAEAASAARTLEATCKKGGLDKHAIVYAVTAEGRSAMVPVEQWRLLPEPAPALDVRPVKPVRGRKDQRPVREIMDEKRQEQTKAPRGKRAVILDLMTRKGGASYGEILDATGWNGCRTTMRQLAQAQGKEVQTDGGRGRDRRFWI